MCGIWSIIEKQTGKDIKQLLGDFWNIKHRGPDNSHLETFDIVSIGFHRLAVMDTSFKSNQPYVLRDRTRTIVFVCNGEVYNYMELDKKYNLDVGTSDCLVLPKLYIQMTNDTNLTDPVKSWVSMFNHEIKGEYAFMLYEFDEMMKLSKYFIGRDHVGVRPLYQCKINDEIDFYSSEVKGMISYNEPVEEYPPGSIKEVINNTFNYSQKYYTFTDIYNEQILMYPSSQNDHILNSIRQSLINSVKRRLDAHRPLAFLLSGGVDSSLVAAISAKLLGQPIRTFCCGMKGSTDMIYAKKVADHIGSNHTEVYFTEEEGLEALEDVIYSTETWDTTSVRASVPHYILGKYLGTDTDCRVVLAGEGPDEICSSYLFNYYAPDSDSLDKTAKQYVKNIHMYDGRRADRCLSRWGLEARFPFLDPEFIRTYWKIPAEDRHPKKHGFEKYWLRKAFDGLDLLPDEILWRKKEAFSDGVSANKKSWYTIIQEYVEEHYDQSNSKVLLDIVKCNIPVTNEACYFRNIFINRLGLSKDNIIPNYWQPKWDKNGNEIQDYIDPSARTLDVYST
jgi:asparagine synthase (glutamine-hydrolysing)